MHVHTVGSSFHSEANAWNAKQHLENAQWCTFLMIPSSFLSLLNPLLLHFDDNMVSRTALMIDRQPWL